MKDLGSIHDLPPPDEGGPIARSGFFFQDHVAAKFCLQMLLDPKLKSVRCETHDDVVLIWDAEGEDLVEFVQVKGEEDDQLWTIAKLCQREKSASNKDGAGTSILERSLARDACSESTCFRLITVRDTHSELKILKLPRDHEGRSESAEPFQAVSKGVEAKIDGFKSAKENDFSYWLTRALWEVAETIALADANRLLLEQVLAKESLDLFPENRDRLYEELLMKVMSAARQRWQTGKAEKVISRESLRSWLRDAAQPYPGLTGSRVLGKKLHDAGLPNEFEDANALRMHFRQQLLTPTYLDIQHRDLIAEEVRATLHSLRSQLFLRRRDVDGPQFHAECIQALERISERLPAHVQCPPKAFLLGCMYEITTRCQHRFIKPAT